MRIGFLIYSLTGGGAEHTVANLSNLFTLSGNKVVIYLFNSDNIAYEIHDSITIRKCKIDGRNIIDKLKALTVIRKYLVIDKIDILFAATISMIPYALIANLGMPSKIIGCERANPISYTNKYKYIVRYISNLCDGFIFQTEGAQKVYPLKIQRKGIVIPNIAPVYKGERSYPHKIQICAVGRLHPDKDFPTIIKAFSIVNKEKPESTLTIFGEGEQKKELVALSAQLGLKEKIIFHKFSKNLMSDISNFTMFVFSSKSEGMPNVLMEAMSVGLPCIATDCKFGPKELIENGVNGWLIPVADELAMADRMLWIINNPNIAEEMGKQAQNISRKYSENVIVKKYITYMDKLLDL